MNSQSPERSAESGRDDSNCDGEDEVTAAELREIEVDAALHGQRLDKALVAVAPEFSRSYLQTLIGGGHVWLDDRGAGTASRRVQAGQRLRVELVPTSESQAFRAEPMELSIVHEDEHIIVVNKPAGLVVHPAAGNWTGTLMNGLLAHHAGALTLPRAGIVHRLDKDTSGLMVVAKTLPAMTALVRDIAARAVQREYLALAHGAWPRGETSIEAPIGRDLRVRTRMAVAAGGKPARTDVTLIATRDDVSAVRCRLHTGRTHQIRVHLASRGHPLLADALYGGRPLLGLQRQALHAAQLAFAHPVSGESQQFEAAPPEDFATAWHKVIG
jgi:23S rRNA pseudouridine1911/1915/1917 synthase